MKQRHCLSNFGSTVSNWTRRSPLKSVVGLCHGIAPRNLPVAALLALLAGASGCNVDPTSPTTTGGVVDPGHPTLSCPRGLVTLLSDYSSTQVALLSTDGTPQSEAFLSSASTRTSGIAFALSGDVMLPSTRSQTQEIVLLDRFGSNVITWADPSTAQVRAQLPIATGFESNPQDYLEISNTKAYVSRWGVNKHPGDMEFDEGNDVLVVDPSEPRILNRVGFASEAGLPARPEAITRVGETAIVTLQRISDDFQSVGESHLAGIDLATDTVSWDFPITGMKNCSKLATYPKGKYMAIACAGQLSLSGDVIDGQETGLVVFDGNELPPRELFRIDAHARVGRFIQNSVVFAKENRVLVKTQSASGGAEHNQLWSLALDTEDSTLLAEARPRPDGKSEGLAFGGLACAPTCGELCLLTDKSSGTVRRFDVNPATPVELDPVHLGQNVGLPPVSISVY